VGLAGALSWLVVAAALVEAGVVGVDVVSADSRVEEPQPTVIPMRNIPAPMAAQCALDRYLLMTGLLRRRRQTVKE
jgi:hypothetical protein